MEKINQSELDILIEKHNIYADTVGKKGEKLILEDLDFTENDLSNLDFTDVYIVNSLFKNKTIRDKNFADGKFYSCVFDNKTILFRMDTGKNAHKMDKYGYPNPVNHINIEIQTKSESGRTYIKWDYHIIFDEQGNISNTFETGAWSKK